MKNGNLCYSIFVVLHPFSLTSKITYRTSIHSILSLLTIGVTFQAFPQKGVNEQDQQLSSSLTLQMLWFQNPCESSYWDRNNVESAVFCEEEVGKDSLRRDHLPFYLFAFKYIYSCLIHSPRSLG